MKIWIVFRYDDYSGTSLDRVFLHEEHAQQYADADNDLETRSIELHTSAVVLLTGYRVDYNGLITQQSYWSDEEVLGLYPTRERAQARVEEILAERESEDEKRKIREAIVDKVLSDARLACEEALKRLDATY